jgi:hypothetical protein
MTQNITVLSTKKGPVEVIVGWDRPMQEYFCNVTSCDTAQQGSDEFETPFSFPGGMPQVRDLLKSFNLAVPEILFEKSLEDGDNNAGNVVRRFSETGEALSAFTDPRHP